MNGSKDNNLLVSIIIPVYKTAQYLSKCLESVISQSYSDLEIIIVDDGSPDNAYLIAEKYCKKDSRISLVRQANAGLSGARNTGILRATGKYLLCLDSDDSLVSGAIEGLVLCAETGSADIVVPDRYIKIIESTGFQSVEFHFSDKEKIADPTRFALEVLIGKGRAWRAHSLLYKKSVIDTYQLHFPVGYTAEDIVFNLLFLSYAKTVAFYAQPTVLYLKRKGSITTSYNKNQIDIFLFIDQQVNEFLVRNQYNNDEGQALRDSLLCRNAVVTLTGIMSDGNSVSLRQKLQKCGGLLKNARILQAFKRSSINTPYFNSKKIQAYFRMMFFLISKKIYFPAFLLAKVAGRYSAKG